MIKFLRKKKNYVASFSIVKNNLPELISELDLLHISEKYLFSKFDFDKRKHSYLLGRISAKKAINKLIPDEKANSFFIDSGIFSFPIVKSDKNYNIHISITHCDDIGITIAFPEEHPIGIDLERIKQSRIEAMKICITPFELNLLNEYSISEKIGCTLIWTIKEALSKVLKTGLSLDLKTLEIKEIQKTNSIYISTFKNLIQYKAISFQSGDYICTLIIPQHSEVDLFSFWSTFETTINSQFF